MGYLSQLFLTLQILLLKSFGTAGTRIYQNLAFFDRKGFDVWGVRLVGFAHIFAFLGTFTRKLLIVLLF